MLAINALLLVHVCFEAPTLLCGVRQFPEGIGKFDTAGIELEAFGDFWVRRRWTGQRCLAQRVFAEHRRATNAKLRLDPFAQDAAEDVRPCIVARDADADACRLRRKRIAGFRKSEIDAGMAHESVGYRQTLGLRESIRNEIAIAQAMRAAGIRGRLK